jgi:hypothetical protein
VSESAQIVIVLLCLVVVLVAVVAARDLARRRYPARPTPPYAAFRDEDQAPDPAA